MLGAVFTSGRTEASEIKASMAARAEEAPGAGERKKHSTVSQSIISFKLQSRFQLYSNRWLNAEKLEKASLKTEKKYLCIIVQA